MNMYVALQNKDWEKLTWDRNFKRIVTVLCALLLVISVTLFIKLFYLIDAPVPRDGPIVTPEKPASCNRTLTLHMCTLQENQQHGARFESFGPEWSGCYSDLYLTSFDFDDKDTYTFLDVGANKAYAVATWFAFFLPDLNITQATLYQFLNRTDQVTYACGSCNDCEDLPMKAQYTTPNRTLHIHAFEPQPGTADLLKEVQAWMNVSVRSQSTFNVYGMAVSK
jgi:hypothetical protein